MPLCHVFTSSLVRRTGAVARVFFRRRRAYRPGLELLELAELPPVHTRAAVAVEHSPESRCGWQQPAQLSPGVAKTSEWLAARNQANQTWQLLRDATNARPSPRPPTLCGRATNTVSGGDCQLSTVFLPVMIIIFPLCVS